NYPLVALSNPSATPVTVAYASTGGTAQNGVDYNLANSTLTFNPGQIYQSFPITIINNSQTLDKTIVITLSSPTGAVLGTNLAFTSTMGTGPSPPPPSPIRSAGSPSGVLPSSTVSATLSLLTDQAATCKYSAAAGVIYSAMTNLFAVTGGTNHSTPVT